MPSNRLEEIREREAKATPGEWRQFTCLDTGKHYVGLDKASHVVDVSAKNEFNDLYFMAEARQDIPYLLERLRLAEAVVEAVRESSTRERQVFDIADSVNDALIGYDAFLSASNPEAGGGKG